MSKAQLTDETKIAILKVIGRMVKIRAKQLCPVDRGQLMASIDYKVVGTDEVIVFSPLPQAVDMEWGKPPELLSNSEKDDVEDWARRNGLDSGYGIIKSIETKGIKVGTAKVPLHITSFGRNSYRPYLRPAMHQTLTPSNLKKILGANIK